MKITSIKSIFALLFTYFCLTACQEKHEMKNAPIESDLAFDMKILDRDNKVNGHEFMLIKK